MAMKRAFSPQDEPSTPQKRAKYNTSAESSPTKDLTPIPSCPHSPSSEASSVQTRSSAYETVAESTSSTSDKQSPFTTEFFSNMASTIAHVFPFEDFANDHHCSISEVSQAISAVIVGPLSDPGFKWHEDTELSIADFGKQMIDTWNLYFDQKLEGISGNKSAKTPSPRKRSTPSGSMSPPKNETSEQSSDGSPTCSSSSSSDDNQGTPSPSTQVKKRAEKAQAKPKAKFPVSEQPDKKTPGTPKRKSYKWSPPAEPVVRQQVVKDDFGNYMPAPTKEEIKATEHKNFMNERRRQLQASGDDLTAMLRVAMRHVAPLTSSHRLIFRH